MRTAPLLLAIGCAGPPTGDDTSRFVTGAPEITALELSCDLDAERWRLDVETRFWSGGGRLYLTPDGHRVESHRVDSVRAARDGSTDELRLDLRIVGDWREASPGSRTAIHCSDDPDALFLLYDLDGREAACWQSGPYPDRWGTRDLPDCTAPEWSGTDPTSD